MAIPARCTRELECRIKDVESSLMPGQGSGSQDLLLVAQTELAFLDAKECISSLLECNTMERLIESQKAGPQPAALFTLVQVTKFHLFLHYALCIMHCSGNNISFFSALGQRFGNVK